MTDCRRAFPLALFCLPLMFWGCPSGSSPPPVNQQGQAATEKPFEEEFVELPLEEIPPRPAPLDDANAPPSLEALNAAVTWEPQPVLDGMKLMRDWKATQPKLATVQEALTLRNTSAANNEKILDALGRPYESRSENNDDAEFVRMITGDPNSTNPVLINLSQDFDVVGLLGLSFFGFDWRLQPYAVAETTVSWHSSSDKWYDKVVIRDDLVWSDGRPVTAHDVEFTFSVIMNPKVEIPAVRSGTDELQWVKAYDDHTFIIRHKKPLATNVWNVNFPVIPKHIYEESMKEDITMVTSDRHRELEANPVVGGAYTVVSRIKGQEVVLERREDWYMRNGKQVRDKPNFRRVRFRVTQDSNTALLAVKEGSIQEMELTPALWQEQTNDDAFYRLNTKVRGEEWTYYHFSWNLKRPWFEDLRVRQAMAYAVDYDQILDTLLFGLWPRCTGCFHPSSMVAPDRRRTPYKQDLAKADALLTEAGWKDTDGDGIRDKLVNGQKVKFQFVMLVRNEPWRENICTSMQESLNQLGIDCIVKPLESTVLSDLMLKHDFDATFGGWGTGTDPVTTENIWMTDADRNFGQYSNQRVDQLFRRARSEFDLKVRADYYREIDKILWKDQPYTWLFYRGSFFSFNKKLRGYTFSPRGPFHYDPGVGAIWAARD